MLPASFNLQVGSDPIQETFGYAQVLQAAFGQVETAQVQRAFEQVAALAEAMEMEQELPALHALASAYEGDKAKAIQYSTVVDAESDAFGESLAFMAHSAIEELCGDLEQAVAVLEAASQELVGESLPEEVYQASSDTDVSDLDLSDADLAAAVAILNPNASTSPSPASTQDAGAESLESHSDQDSAEVDELARWAESGWDEAYAPQDSDYLTGSHEADGFQDWRDDRFDEDEPSESGADDLDDWDY